MDLNSVQDLEGVLRPDFFHGYATAAAQIEGAWNKDGKGVSIWDTFGHTPGKIADGSTADDAVRAYDFYREDVALMKSYGVNAYRFSLSWSRIIPLGGADDPINEQGVKYYSDLIDELLRNGITPFLTLFHWDIPQALEDRYGGMLNQDAYTPDFVRYARVCFERFGDRVKHWITYNEPGVYTLAGYAAGVHAPGRSSFRERNAEGDSSTEPFTVAHTELVSHAHAVRLYREEFQPQQKGTIGITLHGNWSEAWDEEDPRDQEAAERAREFEIAWFADPLYKTGDYPASMRAQLGDRLPRFTEEESKLVFGSSEFYGMNSYTTFFVKHRTSQPDINDHKGNVEVFDENKQGVSRGEESDTKWLRAAPGGFRKLLNWIYKRYQMPIYITENGTTAKGETAPTPEVLNDEFRIKFFEGYVGNALARAVKEDGVDIRSYFAWTFTDNWEWAAGYADRFGCTFIDFDSEEKTRYPKQSAYYLDKFQISIYDTMFQHTSKLAWKDVREVATEFQATLRKITPHLLMEMEGIAEGAGLDVLDIIALNCRSEIALGRFSDGCTSLCWKKSETTRVLSQNWDWTATVKKNLAMVSIEQVGKPTIYMVTEAGIVGKIGFNTNGVGTCLNAIRAKPMISSKVPIHVALRLCLESTSVDNAVKTLESLGGVASAQHILCADSTKALGLELSPVGDKHISEDASGIIGHTNHFLQNRYVNEPPWLSGSPIRLKRLGELTQELIQGGVQGNAITPTLLRERVFSDTYNQPQSICCQEDPSRHISNRSSTLFNIVMNLDPNNLGAEVVFGRVGSGEEGSVLTMPW
ncbi:Glycoside hydrolase family 1 [Penicillium cf. griseofulvum]|uniref:beta-glucosidase n=1 Tax=Penicillium cf. griseofulvum TaxID=2972120 RepID=A0A9W9IUK1_9EURO|nr:Glycoside hydrolase family 1 [Penicillium cf. griseofulvum]